MVESLQNVFMDIIMFSDGHLCSTYLTGKCFGLNCHLCLISYYSNNLIIIMRIQGKHKLAALYRNLN